MLKFTLSVIAAVSAFAATQAMAGPALEAGEVDLLASNSTMTLNRDAGVDFAGIYYYDGHGFMVPRKLGKRVVSDLDGPTVCVQPGTTTEADVADYFRLNKMTFKTVLLDKVDDLRAAFFAGRCDVDEKWAYNIVKQVGNYGEVFDRNLGPNTVLKIPRGRNAPWRDGGMLYASPIR